MVFFLLFSQEIPPIKAADALKGSAEGLGWPRSPPSVQVSVWGRGAEGQLFAQGLGGEGCR